MSRQRRVHTVCIRLVVDGERAASEDASVVPLDADLESHAKRQDEVRLPHLRSLNSSSGQDVRSTSHGGTRQASASALR